MFRPRNLPNGDVPGQGIDNASYADSMDDMDDMDDGVSYADNVESDREEQEPEGFINRSDLDNGLGYDTEGNNARPKSNWDVFQIVQRMRGQVRTLRFWNRVHVGVRLTFCIILFLLVLGTATFTKLCFLLIAYNINNDKAREASLSDTAQEVTVTVPWIWSMLILITAPYIFTILRNTFRVIFKKQRKLQIIPFLVVMLFETLHSIGLCIFVFMVAPNFDPVLVLMLCQGVGLVPAFNKIFWTRKDDTDDKEDKANTHEEFASPFWRSVSVITFLLQGGFIGVATWKCYRETARPSVTVILLPLSLVLISLRWWDNFVQRRKSHKSSFKERLAKPEPQSTLAKPKSFTELLKSIDKNRVKIDLLASLWKLVLTCICPVIMFGSRGRGCWDTFMFKAKEGVGCGAFIGYTNLTLDNQLTTDCRSYLPYIVASSAVVLCGIGYKMAKSACKIRSQVMCFSLPLALCTPLSCIVLLITIFSPIVENIGCDFAWISSHTAMFELLKTYSGTNYFPIICGGFLSILLVCAHIWVPKADRVAATDRLFNRPLYCGVFFDTSLMMNRRSDDSINTQKSDSRNKKVYHHNTPEENYYNHYSKVPLVYICVTMWHETKVEMLQLLKSIFKMDMDQNSRAQAQDILQVLDKDFYNMEAHIIFDNAFGDEEKGEDKYLVNSWVKDFVSCINQAVSEVYFSITCLNPPVRIATPYGGRLVWTLPGENILTVHLKHKDKIRIKKRWSQVMYMYYLLSHKMICEPGMTTKTLNKMTRNTFILTLDGDVDFQPSAVQVLLDRMKKNGHVGAACGRIHPIGSGPIIWYQKFEYAMSHWLQKAAEHVIGCVLCSPGCFSMFRASALMDDNVLRKYAEESTEPRHRIQFDQGEDRWLCTLILQQGHRIEYNAAADAKTYAPEGFKEFYNQRRRWTPSTMANILDLLQSSATARRANNDISLLYILYQGLLFVSSVLTPGTIFLIIFSAINTAYPELPLYAAMLLNLFPMIIFTILIFTAKDDIQIAYAGILSVVYALVMTIVLVGVFKQIVESNFCSMTAGFFLFVVGVFVLAAILHPQEFFNVIYGFLYFLAIPCMSMLLMFYSFGNLNVVSWGTRDKVDTNVSGNNMSQQKEKKQSAMQGILNRMKGSDDSDSDYVLSFGNMFRCICCPRPELRDHTTKMELLIQKMEDLESAYRYKDDRNDGLNDDISTTSNEGHVPYSQMSSMFNGGMRINPGYEADPEPKPSEYDEWDEPRWISATALGEGPIEDLSEDENSFWNELIEQYLKPPKELSKKEKDDVANGLTQLRNTVCTFFFLSNSLFVTLMFILESVSEYTPSLVFKLPCDTGNSGATREPVAIAFTIIFGVLLLIQFICMLAHRFSTLLAIASITAFHFKSEKSMENKKEKVMLAIEEMYKGGKQMDNRSVMSGDSNVTGLFDTVGQSHKNQLMARFLRDSKKPVVEQPRDLNTIFLNHMKKIDANKEAIKSGVDESKGEVSREAKKVLPLMSSQSFFTIAEMLKNEGQGNRIQELARANFRKGFDLTRKPKLINVVKQAVDKAKQNEETKPKVRFDSKPPSPLVSQEDRTTSPGSGNDSVSGGDEESKQLKVDLHPSEEDKATRTPGWQSVKSSGLLGRISDMHALNKDSDSEDTLSENSMLRTPDVRNHDRDSYISVKHEETML